MKLYSYDKNTKELIKEFDARLDELETRKKGSNVYLIPAYSVNKLPKREASNKKNAFIDGTWKLLDDYRGVKYFSKTTKDSKYFELGEKPSSDYTDIEPPGLYYLWSKGSWAKDEQAQLEDYKTQEIERLKITSLKRFLEEDISTVKREYSLQKASIGALAKIPL